MRGNWHVRCGAGEKLEITSNAYLLLPIVEQAAAVQMLYFFSQLTGSLVNKFNLVPVIDFALFLTYNRKNYIS